LAAAALVSKTSSALPLPIRVSGGPQPLPDGRTACRRLFWTLFTQTACRRPLVSMKKKWKIGSPVSLTGTAFQKDEPS
jgi:hypothetical protein